MKRGKRSKFTVEETDEYSLNPVIKVNINSDES